MSTIGERIASGYSDFRKDLCEVRVENGAHYLFYKGEKLPMQVKTVISQDIDDAHSLTCIAEITFRAKLANTEEEKEREGQVPKMKNPPPPPPKPRKWGM